MEDQRNLERTSLGESRPVELAVLCRRTDQIEAAVSPRNQVDLRRLPGHQGIHAGRRRRPPGRGVDLPRHPSHREARRGQSLQVPVRPRCRRGTRSQRGRPAILLGAQHPVRRRLLDERRQSAGGRPAPAPRRDTRDGFVRPQCRSTPGSPGRDASFLARGRDPPADSHVPHGALRLLRLPLARDRRDQLWTPLRPSRRQASRPGRGRASAHGGRRMPQHTLQRRAPDSGANSCPDSYRTGPLAFGSSSSTKTRHPSSESSPCIRTPWRAAGMRRRSGRSSRRTISME